MNLQGYPYLERSGNRTHMIRVTNTYIQGLTPRLHQAAWHKILFNCILQIPVKKLQDSQLEKWPIKQSRVTRWYTQQCEKSYWSQPRYSNTGFYKRRREIYDFTVPLNTRIWKPLIFSNEENKKVKERGNNRGDKPKVFGLISLFASVYMPDTNYTLTEIESFAAKLTHHKEKFKSSP